MKAQQKQQSSHAKATYKESLAAVQQEKDAALAAAAKAQESVEKIKRKAKAQIADSYALLSFPGLDEVKGGLKHRRTFQHLHFCFQLAASTPTNAGKIC